MRDVDDQGISVQDMDLVRVIWARQVWQYVDRGVSHAGKDFCRAFGWLVIDSGVLLEERDVDKKIESKQGQDVAYHCVDLGCHGFAVERKGQEMSHIVSTGPCRSNPADGKDKAPLRAIVCAIDLLSFREDHGCYGPFVTDVVSRCHCAGVAVEYMMRERERGGEGTEIRDR